MRDSTIVTIDAHITWARRRYATNTVTHRRPLLVRLAGAHGWDLFAITADELDQWLDSLDVSGRTRNVYLSDVRTFYAWAIRRGLTDRNPAVDATRARTPRSRPRPIAPDDLERALVAADDRMRAWLSLMAFAGLRCCEVAGLERDDVLTTYDPPALFVNHGTKGGHHRIVPLAEAVEVALAVFGMPAYGPIFTKHDGAAVSAAYVSKLVSEHLHDLGMPWTAHTLRHYFGTALYALTKDLRATQEIMGHADPGTTSVYVAWVRSEAAAAIRTLGISNP